ncbi:hypothetical protein [Plebeiibacterium marinum]|uniref:Uncharacterized protein n=1 Tax=Plebeiibacterium marinum TaxID=2992111 RepID=A0AAE3MB92_9BACT|nr:hypothetical protein [Plebeiobacterium marinum]MCW3804510.1 hypothetical protein [Plebeiobacterium marinum]
MDVKLRGIKDNIYSLIDIDEGDADRKVGYYTLFACNGNCILKGGSDHISIELLQMGIYYLIVNYISGGVGCFKLIKETDALYAHEIKRNRTKSCSN